MAYIVDGAGTTVTFDGTAIASTEIKTVSFSLLGSRSEILLSSFDNDDVETKVVSDLVECPDIVISKLFRPAADMVIGKGNAQLVIVFKLNKTTTKTATYWAMLKGMSNSTLERAPGDGVLVDLTFHVTNLNGSLVETAPVIA